ncbi:MAG: selenocysteine-specific translation elongation factor [Candidatus Binatia bacterium]|nr:selenocysteine-specific translation elongation factor [Candidatus Binatia bacterium]
MSQTERVILGTAGHIDHGKTALIRALTGQETDRLAAEKERGISIELGFAHYEIDGHRFGVVDVPGHERFIRQMLAGAHGIDLVLFTVAADDGIMPQTEEHFDILHLLGARHGVFVITKTDLVDADRLAEVRSDIEVLAVGTACEAWPVLAVSSMTGTGLDELRSELSRQLSALPGRDTSGYFRLPIDRSFTLHGHGLVVTGTAIAGAVREGDALAIRPGDITTRARSVQVHGEAVTQGLAGQRVAVNLPGVEKSDAKRGLWLTDPRIEVTTDRVDCWFEVRPGAPRPLRSFDRLRVYVTTAEVMGRLILLGDQKELEPKSSGWCQIALDEPVLVAAGDRFIARTEAATRTTGGGEIVHPFAPRHRASDSSLIERLEVLHSGAAPERLRAFLDLLNEFAAPTEFVAQCLGQSEKRVCESASQAKDVLPLPDADEPEAWTTVEKWQKLEAEVREALKSFHRVHPIAEGMDLESLRSRLRVPLPAKLFRPVIARLDAAGTVIREEATVRLPEHKVTLDKAQEGHTTKILEAINAGGLTPPDAKQLASALDVTQPKALELLHLLEKQEKIVRVTADLFYASDSYTQAKQLLRTGMEASAEITVADYRTALSASRKYALALLEHFDQSGITIRVGDSRRLRTT